MDWQDDAIVLDARKHGENAAIVTLLTFERGLHAGLVRGIHGKRMQGVLQPGSRVRAHWRARLAEHLGNYTLEGTQAYGAGLLDDATALAALSSACAVAQSVLPEREPHTPVFEGMCVLLGALGMEGWGQIYVRWELGLLQELGFRLDLSACADTGQVDDLMYVSPKTGRAVSRDSGAPYHDKLLALPAFLTPAGNGGKDVGWADILAGLRLTGYFLERHLFAQREKTMPQARTRLEQRIFRQAR